MHRGTLAGLVRLHGSQEVARDARNRREGGEVEGTQISRSFTFTNFKRAFTFMARSAELAESRCHHPDWTNVWNRVNVRLRTFDADQSVTWYDIEMARDMHEAALQVANEKKIGWPLRPFL